MLKLSGSSKRTTHRHDTHDETRQDQPDDNPARLDLLAQSLVPSRQECLGGGVSGQQGRGDGTAEGTNVEDKGLDLRTRGLLDEHPRQGKTGQQKSGVNVLSTPMRNVQ